MSEVIVKLTADHIKIKGGEYVQDLVRCGECKYWDVDNNREIYCSLLEGMCDIGKDSFCSYGERKGE